jgi:hypothetical protein
VVGLPALAARFSNARAREGQPFLAARHRV